MGPGKGMPQKQTPRAPLKSKPQEQTSRFDIMAQATPAKSHEVFACSSCGAISPQWIGHCPKCGQWNTYEARTGAPSAKAAGAAAAPSSPVLVLKDAGEEHGTPIPSGHRALDRLLGSGLVPGAVLLLGGEPGIGKSTLLLQVAGAVAARGNTVLYASGEETLPQVKARAERLRVLSDHMLAMATSCCEDVVSAMHQQRPALLVLDSVQTMASPDIEGLPGNVNQVRGVATRIIETCRALGTCAVLVGHVTKDGTLAGPRLLEHMVDTVLSLEGDRKEAHRLLRVYKNRFGSSEEMLVFRMEQNGMYVVEDPSTFFLEDRNPDLSGTAVVMACESRRPLAVEVQALCSRSCLSIPRRVALGFDTNRLNLLLAVVEKRLKIQLSQTDIYAKVGGGIRIADPALDLGLLAAILSSFYEICLPPKAIFFGEADLNGQIRPVANQEIRTKQAKRLGFAPIVDHHAVPTIVDLARLFFGNARAARGSNRAAGQGVGQRVGQMAGQAPGKGPHMPQG